MHLVHTIAVFGNGTLGVSAQRFCMHACGDSVLDLAVLLSMNAGFFLQILDLLRAEAGLALDGHRLLDARP